VFDSFNDDGFGCPPPNGLTGAGWPFTFPFDSACCQPLLLWTGRIDAARKWVEFWADRGDGLKEILAYRRGSNLEKAIAIYDGQGTVVDEMELPASMCVQADNLTAIRWARVAAYDSVSGLLVDDVQFFGGTYLFFEGVPVYPKISGTKTARRAEQPGPKSLCRGALHRRGRWRHRRCLQRVHGQDGASHRVEHP
jgi:hypothetical protein